jgi:hypothetical protein
MQPWPMKHLSMRVDSSNNWSRTGNKMFHDNSRTYKNRICTAAVHWTLVQAYCSFNMAVGAKFHIPDIPAIEYPCPWTYGPCLWAHRTSIVRYHPAQFGQCLVTMPVKSRIYAWCADNLSHILPIFRRIRSAPLPRFRFRMTTCPQYAPSAVSYDYIILNRVICNINLLCYRSETSVPIVQLCTWAFDIPLL